MEPTLVPAILGVAIVLAVAGVVLRLGLRRPVDSRFCPGCRRARVPGSDACPFCSTPYAAPGHPTRFQRSPSPPPGAAPRLVCVQGPYSGRAFPITSSEFLIGRGAGNGLQLEAGFVSRLHASITLLDNRQWVLYDRDSMNGTWVNGQRIVQQALNTGDQLQIGPYVFVFQMAGAAYAPAPVIAPSERMPTPQPAQARSASLGDYTLGERLGGGGMATVWKATSRLDGTTVAIKVFHQQILDPYLKGKFEQEIRIGKSLSEPVPHPHIARVYGGGDAGGASYMVMEFVDSRSLRERLQPGQPIPLEHIIPIVGQTCDALHHAHQRQIYHRDIKPENILFSSQEGVKLVDFGIARVAGNPTMTSDGMLVGTPYYMSFEQAQGDDIDGRSDLYSLGVVLYEMLTGRPPFVGEPLTVVHRHITEEPVRPRQINPAVPPHIEEVVMRALHKNKGRRFQNAEEMARALGYVAPFFRPGARPAEAGPRAPAPGQPAAVPPQGRRLFGGARRAQPVGRQPTARLVALHNGQALPVAVPVMLLSRQSVNPLDERISREHARIVHYGDHYWLEDVGSTNGTHLNERRIFEPALLQPGDQIRIGQTWLRFEPMAR